MSEEGSENLWSVLKSVHILPRGNQLNCGSCKDNIKTFSPISLFVESLIEQLCMFLESTPELQRRLYLTVCKKLHEMNLIDHTYAMNEYNLMRDHYRNTLYKLLTVAKETNSTFDGPVSQNVHGTLNTCFQNFFDGPRYDNEYREIGFIAEGGFGKVYKAQNKLDGGVYAIKKILIKLHNVGSFLGPLQEIRTLAKLHHPNVVAYKTAWLEPLISVTPVLKPEICGWSSKNNPSFRQDTESSNIIFEKSEEDGDVIHGGSENNPSSSTSSHNLLQSNSVLSSTKNMLCTYEYQIQRQKNYKQESAMLFIQMQLCSQTLRQWLDIRNSTIGTIELNMKNILKIFTKIVKGVEYIHSNGIVHHDIKPSNVFISEDCQKIQIGDFGLACGSSFSATDNVQLNGVVKMSSCACINTRKCPEFGTKLYAAPEQWKGEMCTFKSDIYSLGILFFELIQPFYTHMDRIESIKSLKCGLIPPNIILAYPKVTNLMKILLESQPNLRPCASEILIYVDRLLRAEYDGSLESSQDIQALSSSNT